MVESESQNCQWLTAGEVGQRGGLPGLLSLFCKPGRMSIVGNRPLVWSSSSFWPPRNLLASSWFWIGCHQLQKLQKNFRRLGAGLMVLVSCGWALVNSRTPGTSLESLGRLQLQNLWGGLGGVFVPGWLLNRFLEILDSRAPWAHRYRLYSCCIGYAVEWRRPQNCMQAVRVIYLFI